VVKRKPPVEDGHTAAELAERTAAEQVERTAAEQVELVVEAQAGKPRIFYNGYRWGYLKNRI
jgi:hypothetical protein